MKRFLLCRLCLPVCVACLLLPALAGAGNMVEIETPDTVGVGKPLLVRLSSWYPLDDVRVEWNGRKLHPTISESEGKQHAMFLLGIGLRGKTGIYPLDVTASIWGHTHNFSKNITVVESTWGRETLSVPPKMVKPPKEALARIARERELSKAALNTVSPNRYWELPFSRPAKGKMLSRFGLHRVFNGDTKSRHTGLDFRAWEGTPLYAMATGKVVLVGNFYYAGNCVFV